jgi:hypothetical protein
VPSHALTGSQARAVNKAKRRAVLRGIVRFLPLLFLMLLFAGIMGNGSAEHANASYYILGFVLTAAATVAVLGIARIGRRFSLAYIRPTPRWLYLIFTLCYAVPASFLYWRASGYPGGSHGLDWVEMTTELTGYVCVVAALIMLGRAVAWGGFRMVVYFYVPQWLQVPSAGIPGAPADLGAGTGWDAEPRPIRRGLPGTVPQPPGSGAFRGPARRDWPRQ